MALKSLHDLLGAQLRDLFSADSQYLSLLAALRSAAHDTLLREVLAEIEDQVIENLERLREACLLLDIEPHGVTCEAMRGLVRHAREILGEGGDPHVMDAAVIADAQRIAHYQIAGFGTARQFARVVGAEPVADLMHELGRRAGAADERLNAVANGAWFREGVNQHAVRASGG